MSKGVLYGSHVYIVRRKRRWIWRREPPDGIFVAAVADSLSPGENTACGLARVRGRSTRLGGVPVVADSASTPSKDVERLRTRNERTPNHCLEATPKGAPQAHVTYESTEFNRIY